MQTDRRVAANPQTKPLTDLGCEFAERLAATIRRHHRHLLLFKFKYGNSAHRHTDERPCRTTSAHSRTMSLDSAWKPGFSLSTSVLSALESSWQLRYINSHLPCHTIPYTAIANLWVGNAPGLDLPGRAGCEVNGKWKPAEDLAPTGEQSCRLPPLIALSLDGD